LMDLEVMKWTVANDQIWLDRSDTKFVDSAKSIANTSTGALATHLLLYGVLKACGQQRFYWLWPLAYLTPSPLFLRIRSMAEHAGMQSSNTALT
ncbi:fatty acid desaturase, partial [Acinetobacter baumannii]